MILIIEKMQKPFSYHCWPEKTANIVQDHRCFPCNMMSEEQAPKFHTDIMCVNNQIGVVLQIGFKQIFLTAQPSDSSTCNNRSQEVTCHQHGIYTDIPQRLKNYARNQLQLWHPKLTIVLSGYGEWKNPAPLPTQEEGSSLSSRHQKGQGIGRKGKRKGDSGERATFSFPFHPFFLYPHPLPFLYLPRRLGGIR